MQKIKDKIAKLLELANRSSNEHEAKSAMSKAVKLMTKYQLEQSEINLDDMETQMFHFTKVKWSKEDLTLCNRICMALGVYMVFSQGGKDRIYDKAVYWLTGRKGDIEIANYIYTVVYRIIEAKVKQYAKDNYLYAKHAREYKTGVVDGFTVKFMRENKTQRQELETQTGMKIIPGNNILEIAKEYYTLHHGKTTTDKRSSKTGRHTSQGRSDGKNINYRQGVKGESKIKRLR